MRKRHLLLSPFQLVLVVNNLLRIRLIISNVPLLVPRGADSTFPSRAIIETIAVGLLAFRAMMP
jgi:hypothetical protein